VSEKAPKLIARCAAPDIGCVDYQYTRDDFVARFDGGELLIVDAL